MTATLVGAVGTAVVLGATHAIEPDHVAGISALTGRYGDPRLSAIVGGCFGAGHVVLVAAWLAVAYLLLGRTSFPAAVDVLGTVGVSLVLAVLGALLTVRGYRSAARAHAQDGHGLRGKRTRKKGNEHPHSHGETDHTAHQYSHDDGEDADPHLHLPFVGGRDHEHTTRAYLKTGIFGALFTLSPPLSMIAFAGTLIPAFGFKIVVVAVLAYATSITLVMAAVGAGVSTVFRFSEQYGRAYGFINIVFGVGVVGFAAVIFADAFALL